MRVQIPLETTNFTLFSAVLAYMWVLKRIYIIFVVTLTVMWLFNTKKLKKNLVVISSKSEPVLSPLCLRPNFDSKLFFFFLRPSDCLEKDLIRTKLNNEKTMFPGLSTFETQSYSTMFLGFSIFKKHYQETIRFLVCPPSGNKTGTQCFLVCPS